MEWEWELWDTSSNNMLASFATQSDGWEYLWRLMAVNGIETVLGLAYGRRGAEESVMRDFALADAAFRHTLDAARARASVA